MQLQRSDDEIADSISCLHAIEHFGLGRYGDKIDPSGHIVGFNNIAKMLKVGGTLYISFPIGHSPAVHFNSQRVFSPVEIFDWSNGNTRLELLRFDFVDDNGILHRDVDLRKANVDPSYGCGIYTFRKLS